MNRREWLKILGVSGAALATGCGEIWGLYGFNIHKEDTLATRI